MLRINVNDGSGQTSLIVEGKLMAPWVKEFEACWRELVNRMPRKAIQINLAAVSFIDDEGKALLTEMCRQGVQIIPCGLLIKAIVNEIEENLNSEGGIPFL